MVIKMMRSTPAAPFLMKTYELVEDGSTDDVVSWNETGTTFVVWKSADFARDLLPNYFKHNNFSSFIRQLNTYGFRKIVPDRWEFANEHFKRGSKELLSEIHRRKSIPISSPTHQEVHPPPPPTTTSTTTATAALVKSIGGRGNNNNPSTTSLSISDEDLASSTSTPFQPQAASKMAETTTTTTMKTTHLLSNLTGENKKLRKDNQILSSELALIKNQCEELMSFLSKYNVNNLIFQGQDDAGADGTCHNRSTEKMCYSEQDKNDHDDEGEECLKLFGVWLKGKKNNKKKRERDDEMDGCGSSLMMKAKNKMIRGRG